MNFLSKVSSSFSYEDQYLIYIDQLGTSQQIRETDSIYKNKKGLAKLPILYIESHELIKKAFSDNFEFFGFSDTIIALPHCKETITIAKCSCEIFLRLLQFRIFTRVFITKGDFSYHSINEIDSHNKTFLCPIYGSTILDAYEMDSFGFSTLGVFIGKNIKKDFSLNGKAKFSGKIDAGFVNFKSYLSTKDISEISRLINEIIDGPGEYIEAFDKASKKYSKLFSTENELIFSEAELKAMCDEVKKQKINERSALLNKLLTLKSLLEDEETVINSKF